MDLDRKPQTPFSTSTNEWIREDSQCSESADVSDSLGQNAYYGRIVEGPVRHHLNLTQTHQENHSNFGKEVVSKQSRISENEVKEKQHSQACDITTAIPDQIRIILRTTNIIQTLHSTPIEMWI